MAVQRQTYETMMGHSSGGRIYIKSETLRECYIPIEIIGCCISMDLGTKALKEERLPSLPMTYFGSFYFSSLHPWALVELEFLVFKRGTLLLET